MRINSIKTYQDKTSFGQVILGKGGAERLALGMPISDAKLLVSRNFFNKNDILISSRAVEIIPPEKDTVLQVTDTYALGRKFTDIEVFERGVRHIFRLNKRLSDEEISRYGIENRQISLAEEITKAMRGSFELPKFMRLVRARKNEVLPREISDKAQEIKTYARNYGMF